MHGQSTIKIIYYVSPAGNTALCRVVSNKYGEIAVAILTGEMLNISNKNSQPPSREFEPRAAAFILGICDTYTTFIWLHHDSSAFTQLFQ
jgi:hypothetical protein